MGAIFYFTEVDTMKEKKYTKCILCEGETKQEAVDKFNAVMLENRLFNPTFVKDEDGAFYVYVTLYDYVPETIAESKELEGERNYCKDCPLCDRDRNRFGEIDKRKMYGFCTANGARRKVRLDMAVCDKFYTEQIRKEG